MINEVMESGSGDTIHPMSFLLSEDLNLPAVGETRQGWVIAHRNNEIVIDIGAKSEGIISGSELQHMDDDALEMLAIGNEVLVYIVSTEDKHGNVVVSYAKAAEELDWLTAEKLLESQSVYKSQIVGQNRGGLLVKVGLLQGFVPNSQIGRQRRYSEASDGRGRNPVGQPISVKVIEVDRQRNRLILSERAADKEMREARRSDLLAKLAEGDVLDGRVINLADFGAFVDVGGVEGLVHLSELSWKRISQPAEVLEVGDQVKVYVLNVDRERERLALSIKRLEPDPWTVINQHYHTGQLIEATITKLIKYGAFARIDDEYELEGLIHISELAEAHVAHPREVVEPSQKVAVRIIRIDPEQRQLGLSMKQVVSDEFVEADLQMLTQVEE